MYVYLTASPNARFSCWSNADSGGYDISLIRINTDRTVGLSNGSTIWLGTAPIPLNTLVRIEASFNHSAGTMSLDLYAGDSTTPISGSTVTVTGASFSATSVGKVFGGVLST